MRAKATGYSGRRPSTLARCRLRPAGQEELELKTSWRDGTKHPVMSPPEFIQRLAALAPRPRLHLTRSVSASLGFAK